MKLYFKLSKFAKPYFWIIAITIVFMLFSTLVDGASLSMIVPVADKVLNNKPIVLPNKNIPIFLKELIEKVNLIPAPRLLGIVPIIILAMVTLKGFIFYFQTILMEIVGQRVIRDIRDKLFFKIQYLSMDFFSKSRVGELISRLTYDIYVMRHALTEGLADSIYYTFQFLLFLVIVLTINFKLALFVLVLLPLISYPLLRVGKRLRKLSKQAQSKMADLNSRMQETFISMNIVKAFSMEGEEIKRFMELNQDFYQLMLKSMKRTLLLNPATELVAAIGGVSVLFIGGRQVIAGEMSFGIFALFLASLVALMKPVKRLIKVYNFNQVAFAAGERIFEILEQELTFQEQRDAVELPYPKNDIRYENVFFKYNKDYVLKGIDLKVKMGEVICFVGPSGVGKTTLVNLLLRFYDPSEGRILIDDIDIKHVKIESLRKHIGLVTQQPVLFNDTVYNNICYGMRDKSFEDVEQSAKYANAHEFIMRLPQAYNTIIGERGAKLSEGEKQRIAIARAILKNSPILILDEATAQLDADSELKVQEAIQRLIRGKTVFLIAHRLSTAKRADRIIVLENGKIAEEGKHDELVAKNGLYSRYYHYQSQFV